MSPRNDMFSFTALSDLLRDGSVRNFYFFIDSTFCRNTWPTHGGKEKASRKITLVGLLCSPQPPKPNDMYF